jgi:hypothetical protein
MAPLIGGDKADGVVIGWNLLQKMREAGYEDGPY